MARYPAVPRLYNELKDNPEVEQMYRDLEQVDWWPLILNPQENVCMSFQNNLDTRLLEKDYHVTQRPCPLFR